MAGPHRTGPDLGPTDIMWDHMSRPPTEDPVDRVWAAAAAGFDAIGLFVRKWREVREDPAHVERLRAALDETGLCIGGMEVVPGWSLDGSLSEEAAAFESAAWDLAETFDVRTMQAIGRGIGTPAESAAGFAALCDRAADHGVRIALEFVPSMTDIETATQALEVVERADRPNAGFCVDSWHITRSTNDPDDILRLPGERIYSIQLNDGPIRPDVDDYYTDTLANRVPPGDGEFPLDRIIGNLDAVGAACPIGLEVCSTELWAMPCEDAARTVHDAIRTVLASSRGTA